MLKEKQPEFNSVERSSQKEIDNKIFIERLRLLNKNLKSSLPANFLCAVIVFVGLQNAISPLWLNGWFVAVLVITALRGFFVTLITRYYPFSYSFMFFL